VQSLRAVTDSYNFRRTGRGFQRLFEFSDFRARGQDISTQYGSNGSDVVFVNHLPSVREKFILRL
jgi:hypothetical protein